MRLVAIISLIGAAWGFFSDSKAERPSLESPGLARIERQLSEIDRAAGVYTTRRGE